MNYPESDCCGARIIHHDICSNCGEHCSEALEEHSPESLFDDPEQEVFDPDEFINNTPTMKAYVITGEAFVIDPTGHGDICYSDADPGL